MVQAEELYRRIKQEKPFVPLRVYLNDGRTCDVVHRELAIVQKSYLIIGVPAPDQRAPIYDYTEVVRLADITRIEELPASAALAS